MPKDLTIALGSLPASPLQMASAYAVFANSGYRVDPYFIDRIEDASGQVVYQAAPKGRLRALQMRRYSAYPAKC